MSTRVLIRLISNLCTRTHCQLPECSGKIICVLLIPSTCLIPSASVLKLRHTIFLPILKVIHIPLFFPSFFLPLCTATMETAFSLYREQVANGDHSISWHCEACDGVVTKQQRMLQIIIIILALLLTPIAAALTRLSQNCTCLEARDNYLANNPSIGAADLDPVYSYEVYYYFCKCL